MTLSADNGSNYESATDATIHRFTNTGTQIKSKFTWDGDATGVFSLNSHAFVYNLY